MLIGFVVLYTVGAFVMLTSYTFRDIMLSEYDWKDGPEAIIALIGAMIVWPISVGFVIKYKWLMRKRGPTSTQHWHRDEKNALVVCYHKCKTLVLSWEFWVASTVSFPIEHGIWEYVIPAIWDGLNKIFHFVVF